MPAMRYLSKKEIIDTVETWREIYKRFCRKEDDDYLEKYLGNFGFCTAAKKSVRNPTVVYPVHFCYHCHLRDAILSVSVRFSMEGTECRKRLCCSKEESESLIWTALFTGTNGGFTEAAKIMRIALNYLERMYDVVLREHFEQKKKR
jgi:hypothetical protein